VADTREDSGEELGFDEVISRLRGVLEQLEQGSLSLEDSLRAYEEGVGLARRGHALLDAAEKRVELLVQGSDGALSAVPLDGAARAGSRGQAEDGDGEDDSL
jgi:exodeoxyribonuclease VII small subunit